MIWILRQFSFFCSLWEPVIASGKPSSTATPALAAARDEMMTTPETVTSEIDELVAEMHEDAVRGFERRLARQVEFEDWAEGSSGPSA